jgi:hypothetical protein
MNGKDGQQLLRFVGSKWMTLYKVGTKFPLLTGGLWFDVALRVIRATYGRWVSRSESVPAQEKSLTRPRKALENVTATAAKPFHFSGEIDGQCKIRRPTGPNLAAVPGDPATRH